LNKYKQITNGKRKLCKQNKWVIKANLYLYNRIVCDKHFRGFRSSLLKKLDIL